MKKLVFALPVVAAAVVSACSGGSVATSPIVNAPASPLPAPGGQAATAHFSITIPPGGTKTSQRVKPQYVSPNTQSVSIVLVSVNGTAAAGQNATIVQTYPGASNCTAASSGLTCTGDVPALAGADVFNVSLFSGPNATGSVLASGSVAATIVSGSSSVAVDNSASISIGGVVANLAVAVSANTLHAGTSAKLSVTVNATDASGATIIGPGTYTSPVQLTTSDTTGSVGFTTSASQTPSPAISVTSPSTAIQLVYNGSTQLAGGALNVEAQQGSLAGSTQVQVIGATPAPVPSSTPTATPTPQPANATAYVLNEGTNGGLGATVTEYSATANGNVAPVRTLNLSSSLYAAGLAVDSSGRLYVGYYDNATFGITSGNEIDVYAAGASNAATPVTRITGESSQSTMLDPGSLYVDKTGRIITLATTNVDQQAGGDSIVTYAANASGAVPPSHAWNFDYSSGGMYFVYAFESNGYYTIGFNEDAAGNLYFGGAMGVLVSSDRPQGVWVAPAAFTAGPPLTQPARIFPGGGSATNIPAYGAGQLVQGVALDSSSAIYESQSINGAGSINVFPAGASGGTTNVPPLRTISSALLNVSVPPAQQPPQLPLAITGNSIVVANQTTNALLFFPTSSSGNATPSATIQGSSTHLNNPIAVVVGASH